MFSQVTIYSKRINEINKFLSTFYDKNLKLKNVLKWEKEFKNPIEMLDLLSAYIDNYKKFDIKIWISLDKDVFIHVTPKNIDDLIKFIYERYPY